MNNIMTIVRYQVKEGFRDEFINSWSNNRGMDLKSNFQKLVEVGELEFVAVTELNNIDTVLEKEATGVTWLDTVEHMLVIDKNGSRTDACSGIVLESYENPSVFRSGEDDL